MVEVRVARGVRAGGKRGLRHFTVVLLITAGLAMGVAPALGASGGASVPGLGSTPRSAPHTHKRKHRQQRRPRAVGSANAFARRSMWIWELPNSSGGDLSSIVASARQFGVGTLMIKSSDGTGFWSTQFTPQLVGTLHASGIKACAWQYIYGKHPVTEAYRGAEAVRDGADCLIIDAESEYEGKYVAAQTYMTRLRSLIGANFPLALAGFPYVDFHPAFPYSVFLGPGGAQYNVPQMYWREIGTTTDAVFAHTYAFNAPYGRSIYPLGQLYGHPALRQIVRFRQLSRAYGAPGISWWDWQETSLSEWSALSRPAGILAGYAATTTMASLGKGAVGDLVVWAQEHLTAAGQPVTVDGGFGAATLNAVQNFQTAGGLTPDGVVGPATWAALLRYPPATMIWGQTPSRHGAMARSALARRRGVRILSLPRSASRPARRDEIAGAGGAGGHPGG
ncbi:MAG: peptidoglycan-binding protein [Actinomycetota bacterium]|nr:peptidoglycan-binding protein [Actinomycetota bacterium]